MPYGFPKIKIYMILSDNQFGFHKYHTNDKLTHLETGHEASTGWETFAFV